MSALLDEIISTRRARAIEYEEYLLLIAQLTKRIQAGQAEDTPQELNTPGKRALYSNLFSDMSQNGTYDPTTPNPAAETALRDRALELAQKIDQSVKMENDTIRVFALSKLGWIRQQQQKRLCEQERETPREYLDRESHYFWGKRYLLKVVEKEAAPSVELTQHEILLQVRPASGDAKRREVFEEWYRGALRAAVFPLIAKWEPVLGVKVEKFFVQSMKTKWGSCSPRSGYIRLNTDLAKKPPECLQYIVVHEMIHLLEPTHNARFLSLMERFMPHWQFYRDELNRLPVKHETWIY